MTDQIRACVLSTLCCMFAIFQPSATVVHHMRFVEAKQDVEEDAATYSVRYQYRAYSRPQYSWRSEDSVLFPDASIIITDSYNGREGEVILKLLQAQHDQISLWIKEDDVSHTIKFKPHPSSTPRTERSFPEISFHTNLEPVTEYDRHQRSRIAFEADVETPGYEFKYMFWSMVTLNKSEVVLNYGSSLPNFESDSGPLHEVSRPRDHLHQSEYELSTDDLGDGAIITLQVITARKGAPSSPVAQVRETYTFMLHPKSTSGPFTPGSVAILDQPPVVCWAGAPCSITCSAYGNRPVSVELLRANSDGSKEELATAPKAEIKGEGWIDAVFQINQAGEYVCHANSQVKDTETHVRVYKI
ncbi:uncharacterized protein LOC121390465 [Gigantopelta aegis]|uniref:uncharacterized protein LOC121390465 n=1 Tax=Gigantopelta aegis TaxID=1735272 RepID=UPI001B8878D8|nr:uncharacterized protein LOC121390465 [Gigantopelta aegis]